MLGNDRYIRQNALPEIGTQEQQHLSQTSIAIIGAGGLGCAALPYLASAGIGYITIYDDDTISRSNLHRQTLYKDSEIGQNKAENAAAYARALNPQITITAKNVRYNGDDNQYDLLIDGSDNFATKSRLNDISIQTNTPLISASVNQWSGQIGIFAGFAKNKPCYHCLFPALPTDARNCNEAGILGTSAGITGMYQAHITLGYLIGILSFDFKSLRMQNLTLDKDPACPHCMNAETTWKPQEKKMVDIIPMSELEKKDFFLIVDVRTDDEIKSDPIDCAPENYRHMELQTVPDRHEELPGDKTLAFLCAGNIRSVKAAEYLQGIGYSNVCVLDKFSL